MKKQALHAAASLALALTLMPRAASAQQVASTYAPAGARVGASARALKRVVLSVGETSEGARARITSDGPVEGYRTFADGDRFFVLIPETDASAVKTGAAAVAGLARVETEQRGEEAVICFTAEPGYAPRLRAGFNRLEVTFAAQKPSTGGAPNNSSSGNDGGANAPSPTPTPPATAPGTPASTEGAANSTATNPPATNATPAANSPSSLPTNAAARYAALRTPEKVNPVRITRFDKPPVIDGKLDDEVWKTAAVFKDFIQWRPGELQAPSEPTEALMGYDSKFIYIAFRAHDEPGKVRATVPRRDQVFDDDWVGVWLDTFNDGRRAYELIFNPLGVQADAMFTEGVSEDFSVDIVMESKGVVTNDGFTVEIAIPFKSLRYVAGKDKLWGVQFMRTIKRFNNEQSTWSPIARDNSSLLGQSGHITGLEGVSTERTLELIPSLTISEQGERVPVLTAGQIAGLNAAGVRVPADQGRFLNKPAGFDPGLTAKFGLSPTMTLDFTLNPDFAQVEADQTVVTANQRFPIFFEEKRPFFLEGKEIFETIISAVHTRTIVDPDYAFKFTGKQGKNTFGLMLASDNAPGNLNDQQRDFIRDLRNPEADRLALTKILDRNATVGVLRLKRDFGKENNVGFLATSYDFVDQHNQVAGFDSRYRFNKTTTFTGQVLGSVSNRPFFFPDEGVTAHRREHGLAYAYDLNMSKHNFGYEYQGVGRSNFFRADVGFNRRFNTNNQNFFIRYNTTEKPKAKIVNWRIYNDLDFNFDWRGRGQHLNDETQFMVNMHKQTNIGVGYDRGFERVFESDFGATREGFARLNAANATLRGLSAPPCLTFTNDPALDPSVRALLSPCTFFGTVPERSAPNWGWFFFLNTTPSKKYSVSVFSDWVHGSLDFDFGTSNPHFPRVSPAALLSRAHPELFPNGAAPLDPGPGREWRAEVFLTYKPTKPLNLTLDYNKDRLTRNDTGLTAFDDNIFSLRGTYQFTRFLFARARADYTTLGANVRAQFLLGWTPNPGTSFYVGYNDDENRNGVNPFSGQLEPGFRRNGRLFFIKMSYLIRRSFGK
ncbi:MAG: DUF5916 domain-containing protein [Acidobacteriota bacterium]|nr:DUF5916 domain-containing protein [Acidobacteriota bacterium]